MSPFKRAGTPARRKIKWNIVHFIIYFATVCYKTVNSRPGEKKQLHPPAGKKARPLGSRASKEIQFSKGLEGAFPYRASSLRNSRYSTTTAAAHSTTSAENWA